VSRDAPRGRFARALAAAAAAAAIALFVAAGNWQRDRMHAKETERSALEAAAAHPPVPLPATDDWKAWRYRRVVAAGTWRGGAQLMIDNRVLDGRAGFHVVTPLALDDGRAVLVDRGWIAAGAGAGRVPPVAAPSGHATVSGRIVLPPARYIEWKEDDGRGDVRQNLDPARIARASGLPLLPVVIEQDGAGIDDGLTRRWPAPDFGIQTHASYMFQWYAFAALTAAAWAGLAWRRLRGRSG
jgi:surfeit locus 1 family protein